MRRSILVLVALAALAGALAGGGDRAAGTSPQVQRPEEFMSRIVRLTLASRNAEVWALLHPAHQKLVPRSRFVPVPLGAAGDGAHPRRLLGLRREALRADRRPPDPTAHLDRRAAEARRRARRASRAGDGDRPRRLDRQRAGRGTCRPATSPPSGRASAPRERDPRGHDVGRPRHRLPGARGGRARGRLESRPRARDLARWAPRRRGDRVCARRQEHGHDQRRVLHRASTSGSRCRCCCRPSPTSSTSRRRGC